MLCLIFQNQEKEYDEYSKVVKDDMVYAAMLQQFLALIRALYVIVIHHIFGRQPLSSDFIQPSTSVTTVTEDLSYRIMATWGGVIIIKLFMAFMV